MLSNASCIAAFISSLSQSTTLSVITSPESADVSAVESALVSVAAESAAGVAAVSDAELPHPASIVTVIAATITIAIAFFLFI